MAPRSPSSSPRPSSCAARPGPLRHRLERAVLNHRQREVHRARARAACGWPTCSTARRIPYIGSNSQTMKDMIDKFRTHRSLAERGVRCRRITWCASATPTCRRFGYPAFVKPMGESRSVGVNDDSVVNDEDELRAAGRVDRPRVPAAGAGRGLPARRRVHRAASSATAGRRSACQAWSRSRAALRQAQGAARRPARRRPHQDQHRRPARRRSDRARRAGPPPRWVPRSRAHRHEDRRRRRAAHHGSERDPRASSPTRAGGRSSTRCTTSRPAARWRTTAGSSTTVVDSGARRFNLSAR